MFSLYIMVQCYKNVRWDMKHISMPRGENPFSNVILPDLTFMYCFHFSGEVLQGVCGTVPEGEGG
jgi:hypothetical protein